MDSQQNRGSCSDTHHHTVERVFVADFEPIKQVCKIRGSGQQQTVRSAAHTTHSSLHVGTQRHVHSAQNAT